jgi:FkbM family methyltransferase
MTLLALRFQRWAEYRHFKLALKNLITYLVLERGIPLVEFLSYLLGSYAHSVIDDRLCFDEPWLRHYVKSCNDIVIDIGAGEGYFVLKFARHATTVYAYEPNPEAFRTLSQRTAVLTNVVCRNVCLGEKEKNIELFMIPHGWGFSSTVFKGPDSIKVQCITLDSVNIQGKISLVKIDCEGAEVDVLLGAGQFIAIHKPMMIIEVHGARNLELIRAQLQRLQYRVKVVVEIPSEVDRLHRFYLEATPGRTPRRGGQRLHESKEIMTNEIAKSDLPS